LLLLLLAALPLPLGAHAQAAPKVSVKSQYIVNVYGFATINETVKFDNNGSAAVQPTSLTFGFGQNLSSRIAATKVVGTGFTATAQGGGSYTVSGSQSIPAGGNASYVFSLLVNGIVSTAKNESLQLLTLSTPSIGTKVDSLLNVVTMPSGTQLRSAPTNLKATISGSNATYSASSTEAAPTAAVTSVRAISSTANQFNPVHVYDATRTISVASDGTPLVTDEIEFQNMGTITMSLLYVNLLAPAGTRVTILPSTEPRLISPETIPVATNAIDLALFAVGYPDNGVPSDTNFTLVYQYPLASSYYTVSGGKVSVNIPETPPITAFIDNYTIGVTLPQGATASQSAPLTFTSVTPWQGGSTQFSYGLSLGWAIDAGIPAASIVFVLLFIGLFALRTTPAKEEEGEEEESSSELAADMIKAFDEKTNLINGLWPEISAKDPNEIDRAYFDELRGRLDSFRSRALQRLNEVKQKSTSQKFFDVVNQIQGTEREVDRAAKDKLNLYQQFYMRQMRKEVYDRLLPQYSKRLEKALNQLTDELHTVQRESKLV